MLNKVKNKKYFKAYICIFYNVKISRPSNNSTLKL